MSNITSEVKNNEQHRLVLIAKELIARIGSWGGSINESHLAELKSAVESVEQDENATTMSLAIVAKAGSSLIEKFEGWGDASIHSSNYSLLKEVITEFNLIHGSVPERKFGQALLNRKVVSVLCAVAELNASGSYQVKVWCSQVDEPVIDEPTSLAIQLEVIPRAGVEWSINNRANLEKFITQFAKDNASQSGVYWLRKGGILTSRIFDTCEMMIDHILVNIMETRKREII